MHSPPEKHWASNGWTPFANDETVQLFHPSFVTSATFGWRVKPPIAMHELAVTHEMSENPKFFASRVGPGNIVQLLPPLSVTKKTTLPVLSCAKVTHESDPTHA
jgi:hypothetical protein